MNVYKDMAHDAGARGEEAEQMAQAIEADHRAQFEGESMTDNSAKEIAVYLRQCLLPGDVQDGIDLEVPSWLVRDAAEAMDKLASLEQRLERLEELLREACRDLENTRMGDTADYLLEQAGLAEEA